MSNTAFSALYPTTPAQQGFLLGTLTSPDTAVFVEQTVFPLTGPLDLARLQAVATQMVTDHEILRTALLWDLSSEPRQVVCASAELPIEQCDSSGKTDTEQRADLDLLLHRQRYTPFELHRPPLLRLAVQHLDARRHQLVWSHHHAILDGRAHLLLATELLHRYNTRSCPAPQPPFGPYADWLAGQPREQQQAHWTKHLDGYPGCAPLPRTPPAQSADRFASHTRDLPDTLVADLTAFTQVHGTTASAALVACWSLIAARQRDRADTALGVTVSGRSRPYPDAATLAGPLASTVPLRCPPDPHENVGAWISRVHDELTRADQHSGCSSADLHTWGGIPEGQSLYDNVIAIANYPHTPAHPADAEEDGGLLVLDAAGIQAYGGRTRHALTLVVEMTTGLRLRLVNDRSQISDEQAGAALDVMCALLARLKPSTQDEVGDLATYTAALAPFPDAPPQPTSSGSAAEYGQDPALTVVVAHFTALLGHPAEPDTDFLAAGGHSLLALRLVTRLRTAFAVDLPLGAVLQAPTPRALAQLLRKLVLGATGAEPPGALPPLPASMGESNEPFALTGIQQAYWAGRRDDFDLGGVDSHLYAEVEMPHLNVDRLARVWRTLIDRHPMLRAVITKDGRQQILPTVAPYEIRTLDLRQSADCGNHLEAARTRLSHPRRDTAAWPLFTIEAALLPDGVTRLFLSFDLLIGDALSWQILYREATALYRDPDTELSPLTMTFADYVAHQHTVTSSDRYGRDRAHWRARLPELPAPAPLPVLPTHRGDDHPRFHRLQSLWAPEELRALRAVAAAHGTTLSALLLAAFSDSLGRFTNTRSFLINVTVYNRPPIHPQINQVVGDFTSTVLTSVDLSGATFAERLRTLQHQLWADLDHSTYSGVDVLRDLRGTPQGIAGAPVVFTSTLDMEVPGEDPGPFPGRIVHGIGQTPQVLLDYQTYEAAGQLVINLDTLARALPEGFVQALMDEHTAVLRTLIEDPAACERPHLVLPAAPVELPGPLGGGQLLHQPFLDRVRDHPERVALRCGGRTLTYGDVHDRAREVAALISAAPPDGDLIALACDPGAEQAIAALGVLLAGYAYVPMDASWPAQRIDDLLTHTGAQLVLTHRTAADRLAPLPTRVIVIDDGHPAPSGEQPGPRPRKDTDLAYVIFTSGSTGRPKGVMISHLGALNTVLDISRRYDVGACDVLLGASPFTFDLAVYDLFGALAAGATLVLPNREERTDPAAWVRLIRTCGVTVWNSVPTLAGLLLEALPATPEDSLKSVRLWLLSGDWIPLALPGQLRDRSGECQIISLGGATEGSIWSILHEIGDIEDGWASIPYGASMTGQRVQVLDENLLPCPVWAPGQIHITGHGTALGYWGEPELTETAFVFDGRTGQTWYRTGDWGRLLPGGTIEFLGRRDDQVKIRGYRVELREVETALGALDGVEQAAVIVTGERTDRRLHSVVVSTRLLPDLRAELAQRLPAHMLPATLTQRTDLPRTATGKIDRAELARAVPQPDPTAPAPERGGAEHTGPLQDALCALLPAPAGIDDDLLDAGLTSIDVIRMANLVEQHTGLRPNLTEFYQAPTLRTLLQHTDGDRTDHLPTAVTDTSPWTALPTLTDPEERETFRSARPAYPPAPAHRILPAAPPSATSPRARRFTPRRFSDQPVTADALGHLLESLRRDPAPGRSGFLYPSAGGLYSVQLHLYANPGRVAGLDGGVYRYHPDAHDLIAQATGIDLDPAAVHLGPVNRPAAMSAAFALFLVTDPTDSAPLYGPDAEPLALLNAGYMGQLLCQRAAEADLGLCPVHGVDFDPVRWLLPEGERLVLLHTLLGGIPADGTNGTEESA
ncbi:amino acid adenylation domain-containing protein [Streptomyces sp. NBC_01142]|uniref:non-ribosomal peptide synthetase n=1 Tax=Streptomyces sp. NBC_01142 TaxID=2975865 RepID=UPI0022509B4E|nr:non-ribosomal peptide synthetase [Streptomyces sp. NBC_01142]MCX4826470.1 amino acid adenylation domain-containing protein [Streptomyces sp. NBC_01142]